MRPVKLRVTGLRSYRSERTLDFTDRSLMAILGDTGSGKSSLLEALYAALYGSSTWDGRGLGALIADGVKTLQIELEFTARGHSYTVSRSTSRDNYPPAKHILKGPNGEHVDGQGNVGRRIEQIVGLSAEEFLRVVILPQGRFGQFLQGTAGERTPILRGILGLGVLDRIREVADRQATDLADALEPLTAARARLYPDPKAVAAVAFDAVSTHTETHSQLDKAATAIAAVNAATSAIELALPALVNALQEAQALDLSGTLTALSEADAAAGLLDEQAERLRTERLEHAAVAAALEDKLTLATAEGFTTESITRSEMALTQLVEALPELHRDANLLFDTAVELVAREAASTVSAAAVSAARKIADEAKAALAGPEAQSRAAADNVRGAREQIAAITLTMSALEQQRAKLDSSCAEAFAVAGQLRLARVQLAGADGALNTAARKLDSLLAANRAAHVAGQHHPGDPCPVCSRTLQADFTPATIIGEDLLTAAAAKAKAARDLADNSERAAERAFDASSERLLTAAGTLSQTAVTAANQLEQASWTAAEPRPAPTTSEKPAPTPGSLIDSHLTAALSSDELQEQTRKGADAELALALREHALRALPEYTTIAVEPAQVERALEPLQAEAQTAQEAWAAAKDAAENLDRAAIELRATHRAELKQLTVDSSTHNKDREANARAAARFVEQVRHLLTLLSDPLCAALNLHARDPEVALLAAPPLPEKLITKLRTALKTRSKQLTEWRDALEAARRATSRVDQSLATLAENRRTQIDLPRARANTSIERGSGAVRALAGSLPALEAGWAKLTAATPSLPALPAPGDGLSIDASGTGTQDSDTDLTVECRSLAARLADACATVNAIANVASSGLTQAKSTITTALGEAGVASIPDLTRELAEVARKLHEAKTRLERAQAQTPVAAGMDEGLLGLRAQLAVLRAVKDVMSPSMFPNFVVQQRQTALLRIASSLLAKLTRDAYGFGDDFLIVDRRTGQPRHAKALSGGETFLASLALALALVEISNRSGGQLDALFLDEGFGSLDASILGDALDILREQATGGRLVGVISHLHAVAAELDDVLVVTKGIDGSDFRWLDEQERDHYLLDEVSAGLLS